MGMGWGDGLVFADVFRPYSGALPFLIMTLLQAHPFANVIELGELTS